MDELSAVYNRMDSWQLPLPPITWAPLVLDLPADFPATMEEAELLKALPQIFKSPGGKKWVARRLAKMLPPHKRYVESFSGSAAVFWAKDPAPEEVLNDLREGLIDTFRFIRDAKDFTPLFQKIWRPGRKRFELLRKWKPTALVDRAYKFLWLSRSSLLNRDGEGYSPVMANRQIHLPLKARFSKWRERLQGVTLLKQDAMRVIAKYDDPLTVFYLDPPYPKGRDPHFYPGHDYTMGDLGRLLQQCAGIRGKFLMSLNPKSLPKEGLPKNLRVRKIAVWYPALPTSVKTQKLGREGQIRMEVLIYNYDLKKGA